MKIQSRIIDIQDYVPEVEHFREEVLQGLGRHEKVIPCKYFYDLRGSELFEQICDLDEYYLTRTECSIMKEHVHEMAEAIGSGCLLIECGSGTARKTRMLLDCLDSPVAYVPIDISRKVLEASATELLSTYPGLEVLPICTDYTTHFEIPSSKRPPSRCVVYFPGSTIGNLSLAEARDFLKRIRKIVGRSGGMLIGVDLKKDATVLEAAYDDREGVTAAFNKNMLMRINHELGGDFQLDRFQHQAFYNEKLGRVEMHLVSMAQQTVRIDGEQIPFGQGESIRTECSYKYDLEGFARLASEADFEVRKVWTDPRKLFSVQYLTAR
ncbi:MAG: L-histidine N(alpha)-methyltransferase [Acidobacteriota bacterium]|nr:L-histidine N(alpha)-methyltransferase [Acidobacteriota bacterium]